MNRTFALLFLSALFAIRVGGAEPNTLTAAEKSAGWHLLFDGKSLDGWKANENPETFTVSDGNLVAFGKRSHLFIPGPWPERISRASSSNSTS